ncbi:hypothetical protein E2C01_044223 [Portunus trituberculatus]|uniref:Uncharacterized protein n=1 Tax=Portunus trituberculatus TaxID=210409 RepID=A0A5B7FYH4_PORTR|nr:hypothetical protein [Portunus trituberculatus]
MLGCGRDETAPPLLTGSIHEAHKSQWDEPTTQHRDVGSARLRLRKVMASGGPCPGSSSSPHHTNLPPNTPI